MNRGFIWALCTGVAATFLSGCGGQIANSVPQGATAQVRVHRQSASSGALIYATGGCGGVCVVSYPQGQMVASIHLNTGVGGPCSDNAGNVFVPTGSSQILEYQHGGTSPVAALTATEPVVYSCSIDPTTNNLAAVVFDPYVEVNVFKNEGGTPSSYFTGIDGFYCGYDGAGNLFVSGQNGGEPALSELANGQSSFTPLSIIGKLGLPGQVQWDGSYLTYESRAGNGNPPSISQLTISGSAATVVSTTQLKGKVRNTVLSWIYSGTVIAPYSTRGVRTNKIGIWSYPHGGKRKGIIKFKNAKSWEMQGVTISVAPSR